MSGPPTVAWSVVVPTYQRPERLAQCVAALAALEPPDGGFEIVVVNDGGIEPPEAVRAVARAGTASHAVFLTRGNGGPGAARNDGARHGRGRWLAFTDDDCAPAADWLRVLERTLARAPDALVGGTVVNALRGNVLAETSQRLAEYVKAYYDGAGRSRFFTSNNIALSRAAFLEAGGFHADFHRGAGEDREFTDRWHAQGRPSVLEPRAVVRHAHEMDVRAFLRQHLEYGRGARTFRVLRREAGSPVRITPGFYFASLRNAARGEPPLRGVALASLTVTAHAAYLAGLAGATLRPQSAPSPATGPDAR